MTIALACADQTGATAPPSASARSAESLATATTVAATAAPTQIPTPSATEMPIPRATEPPLPVAASIETPVPAATQSATATPSPRALLPGPFQRDRDAAEDIGTALAKATADGRNVLIDFGANWCPDCIGLDFILNEPTVRPVLDRGFHLVRVDAGEFDRT